MRKALLFAVVCLVCLFMFCSCEQKVLGLSEESGFVGTWKYEDTENVTYRIVFSGNEVQMIRTVYKDSGRTEVDSENGTGRMAYTVAEDGTVTVGFKVGVTIVKDVSYLFELSETSLLWTVSTDGTKAPAKTLVRDSEEHPFIDPATGHEDYNCDFLDYSILEGYCYMQNTTVTMRYDGTFSWDGEYDGKAENVASGTWVIEKGFVTLLSPDSAVFSTMTLEFNSENNKLECQYLGGGSGFDGPYGWAHDMEYTGNWYVDSY